MNGLGKKAVLYSHNVRMMFFDLIRYAFILLFLYAATSKLLKYQDFEVQIAKSPILTDFAPFLVFLVPLTETIIAILLFIPKTYGIGLYSSLSLMALFTSYIIVIMNLSDSIPCSCGGVLSTMSWTEHFFFNMIFLILAILGILLQEKIKDIDIKHY